MAIRDVALRRLILKHCVFGVDRSSMGAEIATLSLWLTSFVPGLSLAYLGRNVVVGDSLVGVADTDSVVREGTFPADALRTALVEASEVAARLADIKDRTPWEVEASRAADDEAQQATEGLRRLFDLHTAEGFGVKGARVHAEVDGPAVIAGTNGANGEELVQQATALAIEHRFLHWPLAFPRVFVGERAGFDVHLRRGLDDAPVAIVGRGRPAGQAPRRPALPAGRRRQVALLPRDGPPRTQPQPPVARCHRRPAALEGRELRSVRPPRRRRPSMPDER